MSADYQTEIFLPPLENPCAHCGTTEDTFNTPRVGYLCEPCADKECDEWEAKRSASAAVKESAKPWKVKSK